MICLIKIEIMTEPIEISFFLEGRLISIERFEDENNASFSERASFILWFRNDPEKFRIVKILSFHHTNMIFHGCTYQPDIEKVVRGLREEIKFMKEK